MRLQQLAQRHFHFAAVRQLDADRVLARNRRENVDALGAGRAGQVALQTNDLVHAHAFRWINFVAGDGRTFRDVAGRHRNSELAKRFDQRLLDLLQLRRIGRGPAFDIVFIEQIDSGQRVIFGIPRSDSLGQTRSRPSFPRRGVPPAKVSCAPAPVRSASAVVSTTFGFGRFGQFFRRNEGHVRLPAPARLSSSASFRSTRCCLASSLLADLELALQIRFAQPALQAPSPQSRQSIVRIPATLCLTRWIGRSPVIRMRLLT